MLLDMIWGDMPAAIMTGHGLGVARRTVERPTMEELFQSMAIFGMQFRSGTGQDGGFVATLVASFVVELVHQRRIVIVQTLGQHACPGA